MTHFEWKCLAYCLMDNHFHLCLETPKPNLSRGMQRLKGGYGRWFNERYGLQGHVFQGRFHSELVASERHALELARYIALNPVRSGLTRRADEWPWSSYAATIGRSRPAPFLSTNQLLGFFGGWPARARFRAFVEEGEAAQSQADMSLGLTPAV